MYTIDEEKLERVTEIISSEVEPGVTEDIIEDHICGDWPEGQEHQDWIDDGDAREIADWLEATVYADN